SETEGVPLSPTAGTEKTAEKENKSGGLDGRIEESAAKGRKVTGQSGKEQIIGEATQHDFFVEYRLERDRTRSQQVDWLREIVNNQNSPEDSKKEAQQRLLGITKIIETEMKLENLLKAENFKDAVVVTDEKSVTIIVQVPVLTTVDKNKIVEITSRITGLEEQQIKIIRKV
ncbi:MAG TPA: SpoIIIAH-like family protein, partial [Desulfobacteria bacterium]|nr:SpoIIIAH-like family protein [Desulfobacteria bacterium]